MSIYSGFATRQLQSVYNTLIHDLMFVFQKRIIKFYVNEQADEQKFLEIVEGIYEKMNKMEEFKYLEPKMSNSFEELVVMLGGKNKKSDKKSYHIKNRNKSSENHRKYFQASTPNSKEEEFVNPQKIIDEHKKSQDLMIGRIKHQLMHSNFIPSIETFSQNLKNNTQNHCLPQDTHKLSPEDKVPEKEMSQTRNNIADYLHLQSNNSQKYHMNKWRSNHAKKRHAFQ